MKTARRPLRHRIALGLSALALVGAVAGAGAAATSAPAAVAPLPASSAPRAGAALPVAGAPVAAAGRLPVSRPAADPAAAHLAAATPSPSPSRPPVAATGSNRVAGFAIAVVILIAIGYAARTVRRRSVNRD